MYCLMLRLIALTASSFSSDTGVIGGSASSASRSCRNLLDLKLEVVRYLEEAAEEAAEPASVSRPGVEPSSAVLASPSLSPSVPPGLSDLLSSGDKT